LTIEVTLVQSQYKSRQEAEIKTENIINIMWDIGICTNKGDCLYVCYL